MIHRRKVAYRQHRLVSSSMAMVTMIAMIGIVVATAAWTAVMVSTVVWARRLSSIVRGRFAVTRRSWLECRVESWLGRWFRCWNIMKRTKQFVRPFVEDKHSSSHLLSLTWFLRGVVCRFRCYFEKQEIENTAESAWGHSFPSLFSSQGWLFHLLGLFVG